MDDLSMDLVLFGQILCLLENANMPVYMILKNYCGGHLMLTLIFRLPSIFYAKIATFH